MFTLGTQYYRPPFPNREYWAEDFARIRDSGLNTVQLWVLWSWVEAKPGLFRFDDYDRLVSLAESNGLKVILSVIPEVQPLWIHREIPGSEMLDSRRLKVVSSNRGECHQGLTPGGCTDHPEVWRRMARFIGEVAARYRGSAALAGWDAWNELRWNVQADGLVCFCDHTLAAFRAWLDGKYGGLDGLNRAWRRRYGAWDEVTPGKMPGRPFTEMMAFEHFITCRANAHARARYDCLKALDPDRPVTVHGASPCALHGGWREDTALSRGNDWSFAEHLDGVGCSHFPKWFAMDDAELAVRVELVKSAAGDKRVWLSEVQGGRASVGFGVYEPVDAASQQRWIWNGLACGADTMLFWCWRDEVFGLESGGFGIVGDDGLAEERLAGLRSTAAILGTHDALLSGYRPVKPRVGVFFSPQTHYLHWALEGESGRSMRALTGYCRALSRKSIPYSVIEEEHLAGLKDLKVLFMPRTLVVDDATAEALSRFVMDGGTLLTESECGAFDSTGFYRYPADRFTARLSGLREAGRRALSSESVHVKLGNRLATLGAAQWFTPWSGARGKALAAHADGALLLDLPCGKGRLLLGGAYLGEAYRQKPTAGFEDLVGWVVRSSGIEPEVRVLSPKATLKDCSFVKQGTSGGQNVVFVFLPGKTRSASLHFAPGFFESARVRDLITGRSVPLQKTPRGLKCTVRTGPLNVAVLTPAT